MQESLTISVQGETPGSGSLHPSVTVAVCTRGRMEDLEPCLHALSRLTYPALDLLVVDNAPDTDRVERLILSKYPRVRYVREPRPGLDWARNRAIVESQSEIIAFTDDDVEVDAAWIDALVPAFAEEGVMAATGLVVPLELENEVQFFFERYDGFGLGHTRLKYPDEHVRGGRNGFDPGLMAECGAGANMAFRRRVFDQVGHFDPALDVGTVTNGGGDTEMFYRIMKHGFSLIYEPRAVVRHRHRRDYIQLRRQIEGWGSGFIACIARIQEHFPDERASLLRLEVRAIWRQTRKYIASWIWQPAYPRDLIVAEMKGIIVGRRRYRQARRDADAIERSLGPVTRQLA